MKLSIKSGGGLPYVRKESYEYDGTQYEADLKHGDVVRILDSGETETGNYGEQIVFKIKTRNGDKKLNMNQSTINVLVQEFGNDTEKWTGKDVTVLLRKTVIAGKKVIVAYLATPSWQIDEYGELVKDTRLNAKQSLEVQGVDTSNPMQPDDLPDFLK